MSDIAIRVENVGKRFELGELGTASDFYRKSKALARRLLRPSRNGHGDPDKPWEHETDPTAFWALKGIDFEVKEGEVLGIIGANGAGKSTLLKVLSRITAPTTGHIELYGRVASLLEVGTGFHPELTGRENVYLNGSILGMSRAEITAKLDAIVDFAGVEKFIDTPVKRYSSGMRVRLGFAVAAHLEPEILIIDEVLAVGDVQFQRKCLGKMQDVATSGRTVLFVSHNMSMVESLCGRCLLLGDGTLVLEADAHSAINKYLSRGSDSSRRRDLCDAKLTREGSGDARLGSIEIHPMNAGEDAPIRMGDGLALRFTVVAKRRLRRLVVAFALFNERGTRLCGLNSEDTASWGLAIDAGQAKDIECTVPHCNLAPGRYSVNVQLKDGYGSDVYDFVESAVTFDVAPADVFGTGAVPRGQSVVFFQPVWDECEPIRASQIQVTA